jgi:hypothetical protein
MFVIEINECILPYIQWQDSNIQIYYHRKIDAVLGWAVAENEIFAITFKNVRIFGQKRHIFASHICVQSRFCHVTLQKCAHF